MKGYMKIHLNNGQTISSSEEEVTSEELAVAKDQIGDIVGASGGWRLSVETSSNCWAVIPKQSVNYVEWVSWEAGE